MIQTEEARNNRNAIINGYRALVDTVKYRAEQDRVGWSGVELLQNGWGLTTKGEQPWSQLMCCASICYCVYSCISQDPRYCPLTTYL